MSTPRRTPPVPAGPRAEQVLIAPIKNRRDLDTARERHYYRLPLSSAPPLPNPPYLAFYQTGRFGAAKWTIHHWAQVLGHEVSSHRAVTDGPDQARTPRDYRQFNLGELQLLRAPIVSRWERRIVFIPTNLARLQHAREINDLFLGRPEEELLWTGLKQLQLAGERQLCLSIDRVRYLLGLALFCELGRINVECDGDHDLLTPEAMDAADARDDQLARHGWSVLRFTSRAVREALPACLNLVRQTANRQGGLLTPNGPHPAAAQERG